MKKILLYLKKHVDFIILDLAVLVAIYYGIVQFRYSIDEVWHGELFLDYGVVLTAVYLVILFMSNNLSGIIKRSFIRECQALAIQMFVSWAFFTVVLYSIKSAHHFSRSVYAMSFILCYLGILLERTAWKCFIRFSRYHTYLCPKLLVVCDGNSSQDTIKRVLHGAFENDYEIVGVVLTDTENSDYIDHFDSVVGIDKLEEFIKYRKIDEAYIELSDSEVETKVIDTVLNYDIIAHKSLHNSCMNYVEQEIEVISDHYVITVRNTHISLVAKAERFESALFRRLAKRKRR